MGSCATTMRQWAVLFRRAESSHAASLAMWASFVLATTPQFLKNSFSLRLDSPLTCFLLAATLAAFVAASGRPRVHLVAGLMIGLGLLTKGPVGVLGFAAYGFLVVFRPPEVAGSSGGPAPEKAPSGRWWTNTWFWGGMVDTAS